jgi:hypothetical protein
MALTCAVAWIMVNRRDTGPRFALAMGSSAVTFVLVIAAVETGFPNLMSFIQIQVAPRIYLIEQLRELLK